MEQKKNKDKRQMMEKKIHEKYRKIQQKNK